jgi:hypothetical protein
MILIECRKNNDSPFGAFGYYFGIVRGKWAVLGNPGDLRRLLLKRTTTSGKLPARED